MYHLYSLHYSDRLWMASGLFFYIGNKLGCRQSFTIARLDCNYTSASFSTNAGLRPDRI